MKVHPAPIQMIVLIAKALEELNEQAVFVGGATLPFYLPEIYHSQVRPTEDVDVVMEIIGKNNHYINEDSLRKKGFQHDMSKGAPSCRWVFRDFKVDIMSSDISALDFTNIWYQEGIESSIEIMQNPIRVKIFSAPYFIASKLEAFKSRGNFDYVASSDMEDIISILEVASSELFEDVLKSTTVRLRRYLKTEFTSLLQNTKFMDALPGAIFNRANSTEAVKNIVDRMTRICK